MKSNEIFDELALLHSQMLDAEYAAADLHDEKQDLLAEIERLRNIVEDGFWECYACDIALHEKDARIRELEAEVQRLRELVEEGNSDG